MNAHTLIDLRALDATERGNKPTPDALPFDLTGCEELVKAIKPHTDTIRERANEGWEVNEDVEKALEVMDARWPGYGNAKAIIRQALRDQDAEIARLREWRGLVESHNASCEASCDMDRCGYRPYFENNGRRCSECPHYNTIDIPAHLGAPHDQA